MIDTDVLIDFLRGHKVRIREVFSKIQNKKLKAIISPITIVELYAGEDTQDEKKSLILAKLLSFFELPPLDLTISQLAGGIKRKYRLGLADAIIAATSYNEKAPLFTFNKKHFKDITEISFYNPN